MGIKYHTRAEIECTPEECKLIDSLRQGEIWTDERSAHDDEYFSVEDHNSAIVLPKGTIRRLTGRDLKWEDDPISLKSVIEGLLHVDIEFYKQKIINFVKWI